jgi:hypothetical protein
VVFVPNPIDMDSGGTFTYVETKPWRIPKLVANSARSPLAMIQYQCTYIGIT